MADLRVTPVFKHAAKAARISMLGVPLWAGVVLAVELFATIAFVHNWRWWLILIPLWFVGLLLIRGALWRDHNALRRKWRGLITKILVMDTHIWHGAAPSSFPSGRARIGRRGIP